MRDCAPLLRPREQRNHDPPEQDRRRQELEASLSAQAADAEARIRATRDAALADLKTVAADVARAMASRLAGTDIGAEAAAQAVARELERA